MLRFTMVDMSEQNQKTQVPNRLAVVKDGVDLLRVIPTRKEDDLFDFKLAFLDCDCEVYAYSLLHTNPQVAVVDDARNATITYHHGEGGKKVAIHVKRSDVAPGERRYHNLPLENVAPPSEDALMPLPLMKVEFPVALSERAKTDQASGARRSSKRKGKGRFEFHVGADCSCVELFMMPKGSSFTNMVEMFPGLLNAMIALPFETWSSANVSVNESKKTVVPNGEPRNVIQEVNLEDVCLLIVQYSELLMPLPADLLRLTFIDNALAGPIMLHTQAAFDVKNGRVFVRPPNEEDIRLPDRIRVGNLSDNGLWVSALRNDRISASRAAAMADRVNRGRVELVRALRRRESDWEAYASRLKDALDASSQSLNCLDSWPAATSFERNVEIARALGAIPTLIHVTQIENEALGISEDYAFLSLAGDADVHHDLPRICALAGVPIGDSVRRTEGRPFSEGLAGLRTALQIRGFRCSSTSTYLLRGQLESETCGEAEAVPLYAAPDAFGSFWQSGDAEWAEHSVTLGEEDASALKAEAFEFCDGPGCYLFDIRPGERVAAGAPAKLSVIPKGRIDGGAWDELVMTMADVVGPYSAIRNTLGVLDRCLRDMEGACSPSSVQNHVAEGVAEEELLADANHAVLCFAAAYGAFDQRLREWSCDNPEKAAALEKNVAAVAEGIDCFWRDMRDYAYNNPMVYNAVSQTAGVGVYMACGKWRLLEGGRKCFGAEGRALLEGMDGDVVDLLALANDCAAFAHAALPLVALAHFDEIDHAAGLYLGLLSDRDFEGTIACLKVGEGAVAVESEKLVFETPLVSEFGVVVEELRPLFDIYG